MIDSFTAFTHEVDDVQAAVAEILGQLDLGGAHQLRAHTVGIVSCYAEYVASGVWKALCDQLPFEVLGVTTIENMTAGEIGETMLALMVLTSDEVSFATGLSAPITGEEEAPLAGMYRQAADKLSGSPSLVLSFAPLKTSMSSDYYVERMSQITGGLPNFGALAVDHNPDYRDSTVLMNGESWPDRFAVLLLAGPVNPVFLIGSISDEKVFPEKGVVTASTGNQLQTVNGMAILDYLQSLGLRKSEDGGIVGINSFPVVVDFGDGTVPVIRAMFGITPEGYAVCGGNFPVGAKLSIGSFDPEEILATTRRLLGEAGALADKHTFLMYSCIGRYFSQGFEPAAEFENISGALGGDASYLAAYSGGELCPVYDPTGAVVNRNHNNTFIICAL